MILWWNWWFTHTLMVHCRKSLTRKKRWQSLREVWGRMETGSEGVELDSSHFKVTGISFFCNYFLNRNYFSGFYQELNFKSKSQVMSINPQLLFCCFWCEKKKTRTNGSEYTSLTTSIFCTRLIGGKMSTLFDPSTFHKMACCEHPARCLPEAQLFSSKNESHVWRS